MSGREGERRLDIAVAAAIAVFAVLARALILRATHSTTEDFFITLRYAENVARGQGFVYNLHERVLGTTTPLYTLLLALAAWLHLDPIAVGKGIDILADGAACYLLARLLAALNRPKTGWLAALLYATASAPINFSIGGMETALVTLAGLVAIIFYVTRRSRAMWIALAILFLLRIDGLLLAVILAAGWAWRERNLPWRDPALALGIVLPWLIFATAYFGSLIPTSLIAKVAVYGHMFPQLLPNLPAMRTQFLGGIAQVAVFSCFLIGALVAWRDYPGLRAPLVWLAIYYAAILVSKVIAFGWYFVPPLPVYYVVAALGAAFLGHRILGIGTLDSRASNATDDVIGQHHSRSFAFITAGAMLLLAVPFAWHLRSVARDIAAAQRTEDVVRLPIGLWLAHNAAPNERVLLEPIGYIGYYSRLPVLDMVGLVSPEVLPCYRRGVDQPLGEIVWRFRPALLLLRDSERARIEAYTRTTGRALLDGEYRLVHVFPGEHSGPAFFLYRRYQYKDKGEGR